MPYNLEELERQFKNAGRSRKGRKKYANDANYWDGGRCEWGGGHNLREDCQTLMGSFNKMENLREIKEELKNNCSDYVLKRALKETPKKKYHAISQIILNAIKKNPRVKNKIISLL